MIVKNIGNHLTDMPEEFRKFAFGQDDQGKLPLTIDKEYVVPAVKRHGAEDFYLVFDDGELKGYPWWHCRVPKKLVGELKADVEATQAY